jgi:hypothetical protein
MGGFNVAVRAPLMSRDFQDLGKRFAGKAKLRHASAWVLCALLLIFCANAKLARYEIQRHSLKLATTQTYLDGEETLRKLPKIAPLLFWCVGVIAIPLLIRRREILLPAVIPISSALKGFDPESHLRPPPVQ